PFLYAVTLSAPFSLPLPYTLFFFFFNAPSTTTTYTLSLHDALPIFYLAEHGPGPAHLPHQPLEHAIARLARFRQQLSRLVGQVEDRKSTRLNSSHVSISYAVFCLKKKKI